MFIKINKRLINVNHIIEVIDFSASNGPRQVRLASQDAESEPESRFDLTQKEHKMLVDLLEHVFGITDITEYHEADLLN